MVGWKTLTLPIADNTCLLSQRYTNMKHKLTRLQEEAKLAGLNNKSKEISSSSSSKSRCRS